MLVDSDIAKLLRDSEGVPAEQLHERASLCFESGEYSYARALYAFIKARHPGDVHAYIGLARTISRFLGREEALMELEKARRLITKKDRPLNDFLYTVHVEKEIWLGLEHQASGFQSSIQEGLGLRLAGEHEGALKAFQEAERKVGSEEEREEAFFYIATLDRLSPTVIEAYLKRIRRMPKFFEGFRLEERDYLRRKFQQISDTYRPWQTEEDIQRHFIIPRQRISPEEREEIKGIRYVEDLGI